MRIVHEDARNALMSVIQSIQKDRGSWEDWSCIRFEIPGLKNHPDRAAVQMKINLSVEGYLTQCHGTAFFCGYNEIYIFAKNISSRLLSDVGCHIVELVVRQTHLPIHFMTYDVPADADRIAEDFNAETAQEISSPAPSVLNPALLETVQEPKEKPLINDAARILLVEDDPVTRWMVRTALKDECLLATAPSAERAVSLYQSYHPDMVLLDINLPGRNGREVLSQILARDPGAYVIMFSSQDSLENIASLMDQGARGFLAKPFRKEKLLQYVAACPVAR